MLEPAEPDPAAKALSASVRSASASAVPVSRHTASCFQRSARRVRRSGTRGAKADAPPGAPAPASSAVSVRFHFVVNVCLLRFPAVVPFASPFGPGFGSRSRFSGPSFNAPSIGFKSVKIVFVSLSLRSGAASAAFVRSVRHVSVRLVSASLSAGASTRFPVPPSEIPVYHPAPSSCSARWLFVLFMVSISFRVVRSSSFSTRSDSSPGSPRIGLVSARPARACLDSSSVHPAVHRVHSVSSSFQFRFARFVSARLEVR